MMIIAAAIQIVVKLIKLNLASRYVPSRLSQVLQQAIWDECATTIHLYSRSIQNISGNQNGLCHYRNAVEFRRNVMAQARSSVADSNQYYGECMIPINLH
jgi:hypothetical protein